MTISEIGTIYACTVATTTLIWNILRGRQDSRNALLSAEIQSVRLTDKGPSTIMHSLRNSTIPTLEDGEKLFKITCTNTGRRRLTLDRWGLITPFQRTATAIVPLQTIEESESYSFEIRDFNILRGNVTGICVYDTHGKTWVLPEGQFKKMKELMIEYRL